jgi:hypothetical protein
MPYCLLQFPLTNMVTLQLPVIGANDAAIANSLNVTDAPIVIGRNDRILRETAQ